MIIRILVGVPRSGKSVVTNELFYDTLVLSADTIRETISPDKNKNYFKEEPFVWKCFSTMLEVACKQRVSDITIEARVNNIPATIIPYSKIKASILIVPIVWIFF